VFAFEKIQFRLSGKKREVLERLVKSRNKICLRSNLRQIPGWENTNIQNINQTIYALRTALRIALKETNLHEFILSEGDGDSLTYRLVSPKSITKKKN
jgi:hypothetical protein